MSSAGSPRELLGVGESGGCARCFGTKSRPSAWPWQLLSTTVLVRRRRWRCSRTAPHGTEDRRQGREGGGARRARRPTGTEDTTSGVRPGSLCDPGAAEERPHRAALLRGNSSPCCAGARWWRWRLTAQRSPSSSDVLEGGEGEGEGEEEEGGAGEGGPRAREEGPVVGATPRRHEGDGGAALQGILFVVDYGSGLLAVLVLLVTMYLALCSLLVSPGPRCSASWPIWSRWTAAVAWQGWYCW